MLTSNLIKMVKFRNIMIIDLESGFRSTYNSLSGKPKVIKRIKGFLRLLDLRTCDLR